jgi:acid phosphatase class B
MSTGRRFGGMLSSVCANAHVQAQKTTKAATLNDRNAEIFFCATDMTCSAPRGFGALSLSILD